MPRDVIGTAYVRIVAMSQDFEKQVQQSFDKLKPMAAQNGEDVQQAWTDGFTKKLDTSLDDGFSKARDRQRNQWAAAGPDHAGGYSDAFGQRMGSDLLDHQNATTDEMGKNWNDAGQRHGGMYADPLTTEIDRAMGRSVDNSTNLWRNSNLMRYSLKDLQSLADDMPNILGGASDNSGRTMRQRLSGHFANIGSDLKNTFTDIGHGIAATLADIFKGGGGDKSKMFTWMTDGADAARAALVKLITLGETLGSALIALVAALANVVSGLFALVAAAGQAAGALAVIPGLVSAVAQAGITMMVGFKGLGKAISEGMKATGDSLGGAATRAKELETAQRGVANASRAVQTAEQSAARAKQNLKKAQQDLNDAYKEGAKQLRDIQYAAEDAALQEERSAINLANARDDLLKAQATEPSDSRALQEAQLAYKEADLAYREARSRNKDASAEANDATKKGIKGTQAVTSAQDRLIAAQQAVTDSNQRVADATIALADAQKTLADTQSGALGSMKTYNDALAKFGPQGQKFIKTIISMQSQFRGLKQAAGEGMFRALNIELKQFATGPLFPLLKRNFALTSTAIGGVITRFSDMIQQGDNMKSLDRIMRSNTGVIGSMGAVATNLGQAFISITDAARPMTREFAKWVDHVTAGWAATLKADNASGALTKKFQKASGVAKQLGRIFRNLWDAISGTGRAATGSGAARQMLDDLEAASKKWADWVNSVTGNEQLQAYFIRVADGFKPLMEGINAVIKAIALMGGNTDTVTAVGDGLKAVADTIGWVAKQVDQVAPMFKGFADAVKDIFNVLNQSGSLQGFATVITAVAKGIAWVLNKIIAFQGIKSPWGTIFSGKQIVFGVGLILGIVRALSLLYKGFRFLFRGTIGKSIGSITHGFKGLKNVLGGKSFFHGLTKSSEEARKEFQKQMLVDRLKKQAIEGVGEGAKLQAKALGESTKASKLNRAVNKVKTGFAKFTGTYTSPMAALDQYGRQPKQTVGGLVAAANDRRTAAALAAQKRPTIRSRIGGLVQGRVALATGNEGGFIGRTMKDTSAGVGRTGGAFSAAVGRFTGGLGKVGSALGGAISKFSGGVGKVGGMFSGAMGRFNSGLSKVSGSFGGVVGKFTNGMGKIGGAFSGAVGKFSSGVGKIGGKIGGAVGKVGGGLQGAGSRIRERASGIGSRVAGGASRLASGAGRVGSGLASAGKRSLIGGVAVAGLAISAVTAISKMNKDSAKALGDQVGSIMKSLPEGLKQLAGQLPRMLSSIGSAIGPVIQSISESLPNILAGIGKAIPKVISGITTAFPKVIAAITKVLPTLITTLVKLLPIVINALVKLLPMVITAIAKFLPVVITTLVKLIPIVITAFVKLIPIIIGAIVKLLPVIIKALAVAIPAIIKGLAFALPLIIGALANAIPEIIKAIAGALPLIVTGISEAIPQIFDALKEAFPQIVKAVGDALPLIWKALQDMWPVIQKIFTDNVPKILDGLGTMISAIISWIGENGPVILGKLLEWGKALVGWIGPRIPTLLAELGKLIVKVVVWIAQQIPKIVAKLVEWAAAFIGWIGPKIPGMLLELGKFIGKILVWVVQQIPTLVAKLVEWAGAFLGWILPLLPKIPIELAKLWLKIAGWIVEQIPKIASKLGEWIGAFLGWVGDVVPKIPGKLGEIWTAIWGWIKTIPEKIKNAASGLWDGLWSGIKTSFVTVLNAIITLWNNLKLPSFTIGGWTVGPEDGWHVTLPTIDTPEINLPNIDPIKMALGGVVAASTGGTAALLGEGGHNEVVKPLDRQGLTASDRLIVAMMKAQSAQMAQLIASVTSQLGDQSIKVTPLVTSTATRAAVIATQQTMSTQGGISNATNTKVAVAIDHLTQSVDALQKPLVGGDLTVTAAPGEQVVDGTLPRVLRRRAYTRVGAR